MPLRPDSLVSLAGARALVTGGAGFLGSHVVESLLAAGCEVVVLDDLSAGSRVQVPATARLEVGSILDQDLVSRLFHEEQFHHVYHLAAFAAENLSHHVRRLNYQVNVIGTANLINEAVRHRVRTFVFASTAGVYGSRDGLLSESDTPRPEDPYAIAKYAMELDLQAASSYFGLPFVTFRLHNVYGERQDLSDRYRNVVGIHLRQALAGEPLTIFGDGRQVRPFTYVKDIAAPIASCVLEPRALGRVINFGSAQPRSVLELSRLVAGALGVAWNTRHEPLRPEARQILLDHTLAEEIFGPLPQTSLETGVEMTARWARANYREVRSSTEVEVATGLPPAWHARAASAG